MSDYLWPAFGIAVSLALIALAVKALGYIPWPHNFHGDMRA